MKFLIPKKHKMQIFLPENEPEMMKKIFEDFEMNHGILLNASEAMKTFFVNKHLSDLFTLYIGPN